MGHVDIKLRIMASEDPTSAIDQLFHICDTDNSGFIDEKELSAICPDLSQDEVRYIFQELDRDGDGEITIAEFSSGFQDIRESLSRVKKSGDLGARARSRAGRGRKKREEDEEEDEEVNEEENKAAFVGSLDDGFAALSW